MRVDLKAGVAPFGVKMFKKYWKIPQDVIPEELFDTIKDRVDIRDEEVFAKNKKAKRLRLEKRRERILYEKWAKRHPKMAAEAKAKAKAEAKAKKEAAKKAKK